MPQLVRTPAGEDDPRNGDPRSMWWAVGLPSLNAPAREDYLLRPPAKQGEFGFASFMLPPIPGGTTRLH